MKKYSYLIENDVVCKCANVTKSQIIKHIKTGNSTMQKIQSATNACCYCKSCRLDIEYYLSYYKKSFIKRLIDFLFN